MVPCDLRGDWPPALLAAWRDWGRLTARIAEGLLVYLPAADVDRLLATVARLSAPGRPAGPDHDHPRADGLADTRLARLWQSRAPDDPVGWLAGLGWAADASGPARGAPRPRPSPANVRGPDVRGPKGAAPETAPDPVLLILGHPGADHHLAARQARPARQTPTLTGQTE